MGPSSFEKCQVAVQSLFRPVGPKQTQAQQRKSRQMNERKVWFIFFSVKVAGATEAAECLLDRTCSDESKESNDKCACITKPTSRFFLGAKDASSLSSCKVYLKQYGQCTPP